MPAMVAGGVANPRTPSHGSRVEKWHSRVGAVPLMVEDVAAPKRAASRGRKVGPISAGRMEEGESARSRRATRWMRGGASVGAMAAGDDAVSKAAARLILGTAGALLIQKMAP